MSIPKSCRRSREHNLLVERMLISLNEHLSLAEEHISADGSGCAKGQGKRLRHCWRPNASHKRIDLG